MGKKFYITTPLYYINGVPHVGHTYTTVIADAIARYKRMCGEEVCLLTGTDEHGLNIERAARRRGITPKKLADINAAAFKEAWRKLGLRYDRFIRTTEERHYRAVADIFREINRQGFIYQGQYSGYYCVRCEAYVPEGERTCPDCGRPTEFMTEDSYFFRLSAFQQKLLDLYEKHPDFVIPTTRMNEIISFVKGGLKDLSISRTSFRWGIPIPEDEQHIFYVWFDALSGYLSGVGYGSQVEEFGNFWPADVQLIGKDILRFHAVYWPAFLLAAGMEPPRQLLVHGWWTVEGEKMSKSRGNFITAEELIEQLRPDYVRYFLLRELPIGADGNFSYQGLLSRINSDLANDLGNLASRTLKMIDNYCGGRMPEGGHLEGREVFLELGSTTLRDRSARTIEAYRKNFERYEINKALDPVWELVSAVNKYIVVNEPWAMAQDSAKKPQLDAVLYNSAEALRIIAVLLSPVIPDGAASILEQLGVSASPDAQSISGLGWGGLKPGTQIGAVEAVYPRLNPKEFLGRLEARKQQAQGEPVRAEGSNEMSQDSERIAIDDFTRVEMRVGKVISAERVAKSEKLVKLQVDIGTETRQVVAGIAREYPPEDLPGRLVVVVANLKPTKLMGIESNGMIVAASEGGTPVLATFIEPVEVGSRLR